MTPAPGSAAVRRTFLSPAAALPVAFVGLGATGAVIPSILPSYAAMQPSNPDGVFLAVPLLFAGLLAGVLLAAIAGSRIHLARLVAVGAALQAVAHLAVATTSTIPALLSGAALAGVGFGLVESAGVGLARQAHPDAAGADLTRLTALVAVTAMVVPLIVFTTAGARGVGPVVALCALPHLLAAAALFSVAGTDREAARLDLRKRSLPDPPSSQPQMRRLVAPAAALFFYVGAESILAGWSAELPRQIGGLSPAVAALGTSLFWALLCLGRMAALFLLGRGTTERRLVLTAQALAVALLAGSAAAVRSHPTAAGLLLAAAVPALAPSYGLLLNAGMRRAGATTARTSASLIAVGALGGSAITLAASQVTSGAGPDAATWTLALAALAVSLALVAAARSTRGELPP
jgi:MFS family permease